MTIQRDKNELYIVEIFAELSFLSFRQRRTVWPPHLIIIITASEFGNKPFDTMAGHTDCICDRSQHFSRFY